MTHIVAHQLETSASDIVLEDGKFSVAGSPQKYVAFTEVAAAANLSNTLPPAVAAAIADALGVAHVDMPFKAEKLWNIIHQK